MSLIEFDFEGRTPIPRWQIWVCSLLLTCVLALIGMDLLGLLPRASGQAKDMASLEAKVADVRADQDELRAEQEKMRTEMRKGFAQIRNLIQEK